MLLLYLIYFYDWQVNTIIQDHDSSKYNVQDNSALGNSSVDKKLDENPSYNDVFYHSSRKESPFTSIRGQDNGSDDHSSIMTHDFGLMYPIPSSIKSPQIAVFQSALPSISSKIFRNPSDISIWLQAFHAQALLINMHEYFSGTFSITSCM